MWPGGIFHGWISLIVTISSTCCLSQAVLQIIHSPSPIEVLLGRDLVIPCVLSEEGQPRRNLNLDLSTDSVRWDIRPLNGKEDKVYLFTNGRHTLFRQNSSINEEGFKRGIANLTLYNVQKGDEGEYTCNVYVAGNKHMAVRTVEVSARPSVTLSSYNVSIELGIEQSVVCKVHKFYPEDLKIRWEKRRTSSVSDLNEQTCTRVPSQAEDGTFNVTSQITVKPSSIEENKDLYSCIVSHRSLKRELAVSFIVTVKEPKKNYLILTSVIPCVILALIICGVAYICLKKARPNVSVISGLEVLTHGKKSTLSFMVSDFKPKKIEIVLYIKRTAHVAKQEMCSWKYPSNVQQNDTVDHPEKTPLRERFSKEMPSFVHNSQSFKPNRSKTFLSYNCLCSIDILPDKEKDEGATLTLEVKHPTLINPYVTTNTLKIKGDFLQLSSIKAPQHLKHNEYVTLTCTIRTAQKVNLYITWLKRDLRKKSPALIIYEEGITQEGYSYEQVEEQTENDLVNVLSSSLKFKAMVKEDCDKKYICMVRYPQINQSSESTLVTSIIAVPKVEAIIHMNAVISANQPMKLCCKIHSFYPQIITVAWYKDGSVISKPQPKMHVGEDGLWSTVSILEYIPKPEDVGKVFKCSVDHQSITHPKTSKWTLPEFNNNC